MAHLEPTGIEVIKAVDEEKAQEAPKASQWRGKMEEANDGGIPYGLYVQHPERYCGP